MSNYSQSGGDNRKSYEARTPSRNQVRRAHASNRGNSPKPNYPGIQLGSSQGSFQGQPRQISRVDVQVRRVNTGTESPHRRSIQGGQEDRGRRERNNLLNQREQLQRENSQLKNSLVNARSASKSKSRAIRIDGNGRQSGMKNQRDGGFDNEHIEVRNLEHKNSHLKSELSNLEQKIQRLKTLQIEANDDHNRAVNSLQQTLRDFKSENEELRRRESESIGDPEREHAVLSLTRENQELKERLRAHPYKRVDETNLIEENARLKSRIAQLEKELEMLMLELRQLKAQKGHKGHNDKLLKDLKRLNQDNASLYDDNRILMRENETLTEQLELLRENQHRNVRNTQVEDDIRDLQRQLDIESQSVDKEREARAQVQQKLDAVLREMRDKDSDLQNSMRENSRMGQDFERLKSQLGQQDEHFSREKQHLLDQIRELQDINQRETVDPRALEQERENSNRQIQDEKDFNVHLRDQLQDLKEKMERKEDQWLNERDKLVQELQEASLQQKTMGEDDSLRIQELINELNQKDREISEMESKHSQQARQDQGRIQDQLTSKDREIQMLNTQIEKLERELNSIGITIQNQKREIEMSKNLPQEIESLNSELDFLRRELDQTKRSKSDSDQRVERLTADFQQVQQELESRGAQPNPREIEQRQQQSRQEVEKLMTAIKDLQQKVDGGQRDLDYNNQEKEGLENHLKKQEMAMKQISSENDQLRTEIEELKLGRDRQSKGSTRGREEEGSFGRRSARHSQHASEKSGNREEHGSFGRGSGSSFNNNGERGGSNQQAGEGSFGRRSDYLKEDNRGRDGNREGEDVYGRGSDSKMGMSGSQQGGSSQHEKDQKINSMEQEIEQLSSKVQQLQSEIEENKDQESQMQMETRTNNNQDPDSNQRIEQLMRDNSSKNKKLQVVEDQLINLREEVSKVVNDRDQKTLENKGLRSQVDQLNMRLQQIDEETRSKDHEIETLNQVLKDMQENDSEPGEIARLQKQVEKLQDEKMNIIQNAEDTLQKKEEQHKQSVDDVFNRFESKMNELADSNDQLTKKRQAVEAENSRLQQQLELEKTNIERDMDRASKSPSDQREDRVDPAQEKVAEESRQRINDLLNDNERLRSEILQQGPWEERIKKKEYIVDDLNRKIENLEIEAQKAKTRYQRLVLENEDLEENMRLDEKEKQSLKKKVRQLENEMEDLRDQKNEIVRESLAGPDSSEVMVDRMKQENDELLERMRTGQADSEEQKRQNDQLTREIEQLERMLKEKDRMIGHMDDFKNEQKQLENKYLETAKKCKELEVYKERYDATLDELNHLKEGQIDLQRQNMDMEAKLSLAENNVRGGTPMKKGEGIRLILLQSEIVELKQENSSFKVKVGMLKTENETLYQLSQSRLRELETLKVQVLTRGGSQDDEIALLRKQFEGYVKQHYDVQEITSRHELELSNNQAKISELLHKIQQLQDRIRDLRVTLRQKNEYISTLEEENQQKVSDLETTTVQKENFYFEQTDLTQKLVSAQGSYSSSPQLSPGHQSQVIDPSRKKEREHWKSVNSIRQKLLFSKEKNRDITDFTKQSEWLVPISLILHQ